VLSVILEESVNYLPSKNSRENDAVYEDD